MSTAPAARAVARLWPTEEATEGGGLQVRRPFPVAGLSHLDPFLLLDQAAAHFPAGDTRGDNAHPHRGFETVTVFLEGETIAVDSLGNRDLLQPGDVEWLTAARGVVHGALPTERVRRDGGDIRAVQLWVNLRASEKLGEPIGRRVPASAVPGVTPAPGVSVRVLAGEAFGVVGPVRTNTAFTYLHVVLAPGATFQSVLPAGRTTLVSVLAGRVETGGRTVDPTALVQYADGPEPLVVTSPAGAELLVLAGERLNEPVARYGPFVMNTRTELEEAFRDFRAGRMGSIPPAP